MSSVVELNKLVNSIDGVLRPELFRDFAPNGLQVEGKPEVRKLLCGVTACQALLDNAIQLEADAILVHHGYFWKNENPVVQGFKAKRLRTLLTHNISLLAYHLPLDAHRSLGNNWQLGQLLGIRDIKVIKDGRVKVLENNNTQLSFIGDVQASLLEPFAEMVAQKLGRKPLVLKGDSNRIINKVAWCTGAAQDVFMDAVNAGADLFITGEVSERTYHESQETGVHFIAAGHHATERYGVQSLGDWLTAQFGLETLYIDIDNPV